jgi:hypothetical protein
VRGGGDEGADEQGKEGAPPHRPQSSHARYVVGMRTVWVVNQSSK